MKWQRQANIIVIAVTILVSAFSLVAFDVYWKLHVSNVGTVATISKLSASHISLLILVGLLLFSVPIVTPLIIFHKRLQSTQAWVILWLVTFIQFLGASEISYYAMIPEPGHKYALIATAYIYEIGALIVLSFFLGIVITQISDLKREEK